MLTNNLLNVSTQSSLFYLTTILSSLKETFRKLKMTFLLPSYSSFVIKSLGCEMASGETLTGENDEGTSQES